MPLDYQTDHLDLACAQRLRPFWFFIFYVKLIEIDPDHFVLSAGPDLREFLRWPGLRFWINMYNQSTLSSRAVKVTVLFFSTLIFFELSDGSIS